MSFIPSKRLIVALWIVLAGLSSSAIAAAQSVSFFGAFNSYTQSVVAYPQGIAADASGNLYISGTVNLSYIPVDSNGNPVSANQHQIDNCCGNAYGLAIDSANNLYRPDIIDSSYNSTPCGVAKYTYNSLNNFTKSCIGTGWVHPSSVTVDANFNVYVLDASPGTIFKLTPDGGGGYTQSTLYGPDVALVGTTGMSMDSAGNFYITSGPNTGNSSDASYAENATPAVYKLTLSGGSYTRSSLGTGWVSPSATTVDFEGDVWVSDYGANEIYVLIPSGSSYTQTPYKSISELRTLVTNKAGQVYGLGIGTSDALIWTGGSEPHTVTTPPPGGTSTAPVTISFPVPTTVTNYSVVTNGSSGQEFTDGGDDNCPPGTYSAGDTCSVNVSFTPQSPGLNTGALILYGTDNAVLGTDYFYGVGDGPILAFSPAAISTSVGTGNACSGSFSTCGDTGAATAATLNNPSAMVFDAAGDIYIADTADYVVRKVTPAGTITTVAGIGGAYCAYLPSGCGDGGAATSATLDKPTGVALDGAGNLYIVDSGANEIREVAAGTGIITTIAGNGTACSSPTAACGDGGAASSATFNMEGYGGAVVDPNANLIIADYGDNRLRSINLNTGIITTVAGTGTACSSSTATCGDGGQAISAQLNGPTGVGIDSSGDYFIADSNDNRVRELSALTSVLSTVAGSGTACTTSPCGDGGAATSAQLNFPLMAATDPGGNIYIADSKDNAIRMVSSATGNISTVAGSYTACTTSTAACGDGGGAPSAQLNTPSGVALNASGDIYIADATDRIREVNITQAVPLTFPQTIPNATSTPMSVSLTNIGNAALTFSSGPSFPTGFEQDASNTCSTSLAANATCTLAIDFAPTAPALYSGNLVLTDNDLNATTTPGTLQTIALSGTAVAPGPVLTGISPNIGAATGGTAIAITGTGFTGATGVNFGGAAAFTFTVISDTSMIAVSPAGSGTVDVTVTTSGGTSVTSLADQFTYQQAQTILFTPPTTGVAGASVTLTGIGGTSGNPVTFSVISGPAAASGANGSTLTYTGSGTVVVEADQAGDAGYAAASPIQSSIVVAAAPASYTAPSTPVGSASAAQTVYVNFITTGTLGSINVLTQGAPNLDFTDAISGDTCSVGTLYSAGAVCVVNVIFTPEYAGQRYGAVVLEDGSGNLLANAFVNGVGTGPQITFATGGSSSPTPSAITNLGSNYSSLDSVAVDALGNVYVADAGDGVVQKIPFGGGSPVSLGSGFSNPQGIAVDGAGNVYVTDGTVKEILAAGGYTTMQTVGGGFNSPFGIAVDGAGNVYVSDGSGSVYEIPISCATGVNNASCVQTLTSGLTYLAGVAVDGAGNVYVASNGGNAAGTVYQIMAVDGSIPSSNPTINQLGGGYFLHPNGVAVDIAGNVYVADTQNKVVRQILAVNGSVPVNSTVMNNVFLDSGFPSPYGLSLDALGNVYVAGGASVEELNFANAPVLTFAPTLEGGTNGPQTVTISNIGNTALTLTASGLAAPIDFMQVAGSGTPADCADNGTVGAGASCNLSIEFEPKQVGSPLSESFVLTDNALNAIPATQSIVLSGTATADATATALQINPSAMAAGTPTVLTLTITDTTNGGSIPTGSVTLTETFGATVTPLNGGNPVPLISGVATLPSVTFNGIGQHTITASYSGDTGFLASSSTSVAIVDASSSVGTALASFPATLTFTSSGTLANIQVLTQGAPNLDFTDAASGDTCSLTAYYNLGDTCVVNVIFTPKYAGPRYGAVVLEDGSGNLLASTYINGVGTGAQVTFANTTTGYALPISTSTLGGSFDFNNPLGVAVDASGNVYIADTGNQAVEEIPAGCTLSTCVTTLGGGFSFGQPYGVAVDGAGNVFVSDNGNQEVYEILAAGGYTTVNPLGTSESNSNPKGIALDGAGNVYISGSNNGVYEIPAAGGYTTDIPLGGNFLNPGGVAVDGAGNVYVADSNNSNVKEMPSGCTSSTCVTQLFSLGYPSGLAIDAAGDVYIPNGLIEFPAGSGYTQSNYLSPSASNASAIAVAANGNVFFTNGNTVEEFDYADTPSLTYPTATLADATDTTDGTQTVTASNIGNAGMNFSSVTYPTDFSQADTSGACSSSTPLALGTSCLLPINFTPTQAGSPLSESLVLTDNALGGTTVTQSISLSGTGLPLPVATQAIASTVLTQNHAATSFTPVTGSAGTAPLTYSVSPALPTGLVLNTSTGAITGTPTEISAASSYTITVTDANNATATATFSLTVNAAVEATQSVASTTLTQNHAAVSFTPASGSGGTGTLTYSVSPTLPTGLVFDTSTGAITGTPTGTSMATSYTVTVTDANGATTTADFSLTVDSAVVATQEVASTALTQNYAATFTPVAGSGGYAPLIYTVSPGLPAGLVLNPNTGAITGTPTGTSVATSYTVTVTDANNATATASFGLTVNSAVVATQVIATDVLTQNHMSAAFTPVTGSGGTAPLTYSVSPGLPTGLALDPNTGAITGTPTGTSLATSYTVTVTDANGATATANFSLTVDSALVATQGVTSTALTQNYAAMFTPVTGSGGYAPLTYTVSPGLPAGLVLNPNTGAITGTPAGTSVATSYTVTVTDANGATGTANFSLTVNSAVVATQSIGVEVLTFYQTVTPFTPVAGSGGTSPLSYSVSPTLPAGLMLDASTGVISGTPTAVSTATSYTVTVTDSNGATATASFSLGVAQQASVTVVSASPSTATPVQSVTLSATVTPTISGTPVTPIGAVTFFNGTTQLGAAVTLSGGTAQLVMPSLPPGQTAVITAVYSGDGNFLGSTSGNSASVVVGPLDFTFTNTGTAAYTAAPGAVAAYSFALAPLYGSYAGPVSFTVTGLPAGAVASFTPSAVAADGGPVPVTMTVQTATSLAHNHNSPLGRGVVLALLLLPFGIKRNLREKLRGRMLLLVLLLAGTTAAVTGCGSNNGFMLQSPGTYTLTVTATGGTLQHSQTVTLIVQ